MEAYVSVPLLSGFDGVCKAHAINVIDRHDRRVHKIARIATALPAKTHFSDYAKEHLGNPFGYYFVRGR